LDRKSYQAKNNIGNSMKQQLSSKNLYHSYNAKRPLSQVTSTLSKTQLMSMELENATNHINNLTNQINTNVSLNFFNLKKDFSTPISEKNGTII
jgi:uncharacterized FlaG/YvyC family protein